MSTLAEIEAAAEALPQEQIKELIRFLEAQLEAGAPRAPAARLVAGAGGLLLLEAPAGAPPMTTESVKKLLEDFP